MSKATPKQQRSSWDEYFMKITEAVGERGTCNRGRSGCVVVKDNRILTTGYVGSPSGMPHCDEVGHEMQMVTHANGKESNHCIRTAHAEQNAIAQAAKYGVTIDGATLYCKMTPCYTCAKIIINSGVTRVVAEKDYHAGGRSRQMLKEADISLEIIDDTVERYENSSN